MNKKIGYGVAGAGLVAGLLALSSCAGMTQQSGPDPLPANVKPPKVIGAYQLPDGFRNVVVFCDGPNSLAITSRGSNLAGGQNGGGLTSSVALVKLADERCTR